jgi:hypothetical protein
MALPVACVMCMVNPDNMSLVVPVAQATVITVPFLFRHHIVNAARRRVGRPVADEPQSAEDDGCDTPPGDVAHGPQSPGTLRP